ncbi:ABC transporter substrate-binding protein [Kamptonema formosum]|uniref:ABC transporter substrate-binding protein n=1 Tax=Kamptonema formosum TaxID=331992 RepID=UPI0003456A55|nr:ABC transporter substrate-binding protein [Oscillatoria sp. PCC 10802]
MNEISAGTVERGALLLNRQIAMKNPVTASLWQKLPQKYGFTGILGILSVFLVLGVALLFNPPALTRDKVTLNVLIAAAEKTQWAPLVEEFHAKNPDIHFNILEAPNATDAVEDLYTSAFILGDSPYDLVYMDIVWVPKFAAAGWLVDLSDRLSQQELAEFMPEDINGGRYQGGLYRIPFTSDAGLLYYRKDLLQKAGYKPPETFNELVKISQALQKQGAAQWGYVWQGRQYEGLAATFVEVLHSTGGFWINPETGEVGLDKPQGIEAVEILLNTIESGISPPGVTTYQEEETRRLFQSGKAVFLRNWPYVWDLANQADSPVRGKIALKPMVHASGGASGACLGGWGLGISKSTKHPEEAWRAIKFFTSADAQKKYTLDTGKMPARQALYTDAEILAKYSHFLQILKVLDNSVLRPPIPQYAQASDILQRYLSAALTKRLSPEQAMKAAAGETRRLLGS